VTTAWTKQRASSSSSCAPSGLAARSFSHFSDSGATLNSVFCHRFRALVDFFSVIVSFPRPYAVSFNFGLSPARDARRTTMSKLNCPTLPRLISDTRTCVILKVFAA
jgi:hypothetical protein